MVMLGPVLVVTVLLIARSVTGLPLVGEKISEFWQTSVAGGAAVLWPHLQPYAGMATGWLLKQVHPGMSPLNNLAEVV